MRLCGLTGKMPCLNFSLYSYAFTPRKTLPSTKVSTIQNFDRPAWFCLEASKARTIVTLEQMSTNVLNAPTYSCRWTSCGVGQLPGGAPKRSTIYVAIKPAKNIISVERKSHKQSLPRPSGNAG